MVTLSCYSAAYTPMHEAAEVGGGPRDQEINSRSSETTPGADHGFESAKKKFASAAGKKNICTPVLISHVEHGHRYG